MNKFRIKGVVLCPCGGQLISNSGKVMGSSGLDKIRCWGCGKEYPTDEVFDQRKEGETVTYKPKDRG